MENRGYDQTLSSPAWKSIIQSSAWLTGMYAITHPSQPNYVSMIAGSTLNCKDNNYFSTNETTIIDLFNRAGVSWKSYQENYTSFPVTTSPNCNDAMELSNGLYVRRHNPFMFSAAVRNSTTECEKIVNADQLAIDLATQQLPQFSFYTPNIRNDAHDTDLTYGGNYLKNWLNMHLNDSNFTRGTLLIVTFDEDESNAGQTNHIPALLWGPDYLYSGISISGTFNHYSLTKLLEENWDLGNLGRKDVTASSLMDIWRSDVDSNYTTNITTTMTSKANHKDNNLLNLRDDAKRMCEEDIALFSGLTIYFKEKSESVR
ncbi:hypothetical protein I4U23_012144 [Adineta vaga]|nr:hypothetical protein I4U23_012144 [Adineta vaga]